MRGKNRPKDSTVEFVLELRVLERRSSQVVDKLRRKLMKLLQETSSVDTWVAMTLPTNQTSSNNLNSISHRVEESWREKGFDTWMLNNWPNCKPVYETLQKYSEIKVFSKRLMTDDQKCIAYDKNKQPFFACLFSREDVFHLCRSLNWRRKKSCYLCF